MRNFLIAFAALVLAGIAMLLFAYAEARSDPVVRGLRIGVADWPAGERPVTVALLSDIHIGSAAMDADRLARIVAQVGARRPDLILIAGDLVFGHDPQAGARFAGELRAPLSRLRAPLGVVAVPGNHDHWTALPAIRRALEAAGTTVLANGAVRRGPLRLLAIDDAFSGHADVPATLRAGRVLGGVPVALTHAPELAGTMPREVRVLLAGHTHCGQIVLPLLGAPAEWTSGAKLYDPRYRCGVVRDGGRLTVVTAGLGTSGLPLRLGARPDWWLITFGPR